MKNNNRRQFIRKSILGLSAAAMLPDLLKNTISNENTLITPADLPSRTLGKTGIITPLLSMGAAEASDAKFVRGGYEAGIKLFFSATYYGEGNNEKLVGDGLRGLPRDSFVIGTACPPDGLDTRTGLFTRAFRPDDYIKKAETSLKRFGLEYVDIFLFPYAGKKQTILDEGVLKALEQLKKQGKTKFVGIASHSDTEEALTAATDTGVYDVAMIAYNYKIINKETLNKAIDRAVKSGMGIVAMKTTAGAGRNRSGSQLNMNTALKWVLQNKNITSIVSGMTTFEQLQNNLTMVKDISLSEQELKELETAFIERGTSLYCQQCRNCIPQCPHNYDIPSLMRSYMYAYGYRDLSKAWHILSDTGISANPCESCDCCQVKCMSDFNIRDKITDIARLKNLPEDFISA